MIDVGGGGDGDGDASTEQVWLENKDRHNHL